MGTMVIKNIIPCINAIYNLYNYLGGRKQERNEAVVSHLTKEAL